jgi:molybdopterin-biosynthesis enzyme MoeA-like protein
MDKKLTAALVIIGNEILSGRTQDININWIATKMSDQGIKLLEVRVVPDIEEAIIFAINELRHKVGYLFTTGGIGPTHDDITAATIAKAFGVEFALNADARKILLGYYGSEAELTPARLRMAHIPVGATLIDNPVSGAPGFQMDNVYVMAGVPRIMQGMLDSILPNLASGQPYLSNTVSCDLPESKIAETLGNIQNQYESVDIGSYPHFRSGSMGLAIVLRSTDNGNLHDATRDVVDMVRSYGVEPTGISVRTDGSPIV